MGGPWFMQKAYSKENNAAVTHGYMGLIKCPVAQTFGRIRPESDYHLHWHQIEKVFKDLLFDQCMCEWHWYAERGNKAAVNIICWNNIRQWQRQLPGAIPPSLSAQEDGGAGDPAEARQDPQLQLDTLWHAGLQTSPGIMETKHIDGRKTEMLDKVL